MRNLMMIYGITILLTTMSAGMIHAQSTDWTIAFSSVGANLEWATTMARDNDGNIFVTGVYLDNCSFDDIDLVPGASAFGTAYVAKFEPTGTAQWVIPLAAAGTSHIVARSLAIDNAGNCYFTGIIYALDPDTPILLEFAGLSAATSAGMPSQLFVAKIAPDGTGIWLTQINDESDPSDLGFGGQLSFDDSENLYLSGIFDNTVNFDDITLTSANSGISDTYLAKLDTDGNFIWAEHIYAAGTQGFFNIGMESADDGVFMSDMWTGDTVFVAGLYAVNDEPLIGLNADRWIAKINGDGDAEWIQREAGSDDEFPALLARASDGGVLCLSKVYSPLEIDGQTTSDLATIITKYNASGDFQFVNELPADLTIQNFSASGNSFFASGSFSSAQVQVGDYTFDNAGGTAGTQDGVLVKLDNQANPTWAYSFGGSESDYMTDALALSNGDIVALGGFSSSEIELGSIVLTNTGDLTTDFFIAQIQNPTGILEFNQPKTLSLYPNPTKDLVQFNFEKNGLNNSEINVHDMHGRLVLQSNKPLSIANNLNVSTLDNGIYLLEIKGKEGHYVGKFIVNR